MNDGSHEVLPHVGRQAGWADGAWWRRMMLVRPVWLVLCVGGGELAYRRDVRPWWSHGQCRRVVHDMWSRDDGPSREVFCDQFAAQNGPNQLQNHPNDCFPPTLAILVILAHFDRKPGYISTRTHFWTPKKHAETLYLDVLPPEMS